MPGQPASCRRKYVREEALEAKFAKLLGCFHFDDEALAWVREALHASHADQRAPGGDQRLQAEHAPYGQKTETAERAVSVRRRRVAVREGAL